METKRKPQKQAPISFYLGDKVTAKVRKARLDALAAELGITRSVLIQQIADGEYDLTPRERHEKAS